MTRVAQQELDLGGLRGRCEFAYLNLGGGLFGIGEGQSVTTHAPLILQDEGAVWGGEAFPLQQAAKGKRLSNILAKHILDHNYGIIATPTVKFVSVLPFTQEWGLRFQGNFSTFHLCGNLLHVQL